ncbi:Uncharacterised protein [Legionella israelensis]|nr:Uncharacterised protein [Legionella israelensis]
MINVINKITIRNQLESAIKLCIDHTLLAVLGKYKKNSR